MGDCQFPFYLFDDVYRPQGYCVELLKILPMLAVIIYPLAQQEISRSTGS